MIRRSRPFHIVHSAGFAALFCLLASRSAFSADPTTLPAGNDPQEVVATLESSIPDLMSKNRIPGLQAALIDQGEVIWSRGFGLMNVTTREPVTAETIFEAASMTKPLFAYTVMRMVDDGLLDLTTPLVEYLPEKLIETHLGHPLSEPGFRRDWFEKIDARSVLSHSSGMPHGDDRPPYPLFFEPGTDFRYSAEGYYLLQRVIEHLKQKLVEDIVDEYVLQPLGMRDSWLVWKNEFEHRIASGHDLLGQPQDHRRRRLAHSAASLYTTASDYARFVAAVLNRQLLTESTHQQFLTSQSTMDEDRGLTWSLGFGLQKDAKGTAFWQWGDYGIFRNYIIAYPEHKMALVYLSNSYQGLMICPQMVKLALGGEARGSDFLGYNDLDPVREIAWAIQDKAPAVIDTLLPDMMRRFPEELTVEAISELAGSLNGAGLRQEAQSLYLFQIRQHPDTAKVFNDMGRFLAERGDLAQARDTYKKGRDRAQNEEADAATTQWGLDYIQALDQPIALTEDYLHPLAGNYGPREVIYERGQLYYRAEGEPIDFRRKLFPLTNDTFMIEGSMKIRLRFVLGEDGRATKIIRMFDSGYRFGSNRGQ